MSDWLPTLQRIAIAARADADPLLSLPRWLDSYARAAGQPTGAGYWFRGERMPGLVLWRALVASAGQSDRWGELSAAWHAEADRRAGQRRRITAADLASVEGLSDAAAAVQLGRTRAGVWQARRRAGK